MEFVQNLVTLAIAKAEVMFKDKVRRKYLTAWRDTMEFIKVRPVRVTRFGENVLISLYFEG